MAKRHQNINLLSVLHPICCGLDVHKEKISACLIRMDKQGKENYEIRGYGTFTDQFIELRE